MLIVELAKKKLTGGYIGFNILVKITKMKL